MPAQPPRDASGAAIPHDHDEIADEATVIRRISIQQTIVKDGVRRISSIAYRPSNVPNGGMSIDIEPFIVADGLDPITWVTTPRWIGSVCFKASFLREHEFQVGYDPIMEDPPNPYHGEVWGNFSRSKQTALLDNAEWFVEISDVALR